MLHDLIPAIISLAFLAVAILYAFVSDPYRIQQSHEFVEGSHQTERETRHVA